MANQQNRSMVSEVSICNQALSWLGAEAISSLDENSTEAEHCRNNYPFVRDAVLEERLWTFATVRESSTAADLDGFGVAYRHAIPVEWLQVFRVYCSVSGANPDNWTQSEGWRREGRFILADDATVYMWGVSRVEDTGYYSSLFVQAVAARLAATLAPAVTDDAQLSARLWAMYQAFLSDAATRDGQQGRNERLRSNTLVNVRG